MAFVEVFFESKRTNARGSIYSVYMPLLYVPWYIENPDRKSSEQLLGMTCRTFIVGAIEYR
jgi:hypothetical protein